MKRKKFIIQENMIVCVDPENFLKQKENGLIHAKTIRLHKKSLFKDNIWEVCDYYNPNAGTTLLPESLLYPLGTIATRFPIDMPFFNDQDSMILRYVADTVLESWKNLNDRVDIQNKSARIISTKKSVHDRLKAISAKIDLSIKMREI